MKAKDRAQSTTQLGAGECAVYFGWEELDGKLIRCIACW